MPVMDPHQDWFLDSAKEEGGVTIMEFHRALHTGDSLDLDIPVSTLPISSLAHSQRRKRNISVLYACSYP